jgi:hypothetical protein
MRGRQNDGDRKLQADVLLQSFYTTKTHRGHRHDPKPDQSAEAVRAPRPAERYERRAAAIRDRD